MLKKIWIKMEIEKILMVSRDPKKSASYDQHRIIYYRNFCDDLPEIIFTKVIVSGSPETDAERKWIESIVLTRLEPKGIYYVI